jgi:type IV secretory pathway VirB4 component
MAQLTTQKFLEIEDIREGVIILKNKTLQGILMVSSLNFALKSEEEQNAILYQFQAFLNSLDFSCQIVVQSRKLNITGYLEKLKELEEIQQNELLRIQTREYRQFIKELVEQEQILTKNFFVVIPYSPLEAIGTEKKGGILGKAKIPELSEENFQRLRNQLFQRMEYVALSLRRCGLQAVPLTTPEIVELFWSLHHPKEAEVGFYPEFPLELMI